MHIVMEGDQIILKIKNNEGLLYSVTDSLIKPFELIKTLSKKEVNEYETKKEIN